MAKRAILARSKPQAYVNLDVETTADYESLQVKGPDGELLCEVKVIDGQLQATSSPKKIKVTLPEVKASSKNDSGEADES